MYSWAIQGKCKVIFIIIFPGYNFERVIFTAFVYVYVYVYAYAYAYVYVYA